MSYFNSQPHEEADLRDPVFKNSLYISTHSLTKKLTNKSVIGALNELFQLTASRRGWPFCFPPFVLSWYFNSQPHEEADKFVLPLLYSALYFNSQPHEEADIFCHKNTPFISHFNSQPHEEADGLYQAEIRVYRYFNSQPHEEADGNLFTALCYLTYFNSQPHEEADAIEARPDLPVDISTHSLTKRLTSTIFSTS